MQIWGNGGRFCLYTPCTFLCYMLHGITDKSIIFWLNNYNCRVPPTQGLQVMVAWGHGVESSQAKCARIACWLNEWSLQPIGLQRISLSVKRYWSTGPVPISAVITWVNSAGGQIKGKGTCVGVGALPCLNSFDPNQLYQCIFDFDTAQVGTPNTGQACHRPRWL